MAMTPEERQRLRDNELATALSRAGGFAAEKRKPLISVAIAVVLLLVIAGGVYAWQQNTETRSRALLAEAMVIAEGRVNPPPAEGSTTPAQAPLPNTYASVQAKNDAALAKFQAAAQAYPTSDAGVTARFHAASTLVQLGRFEEALPQYDQVIADADGVLTRTALLGKAEALSRLGRHDDAVAAFQQVSDARDSRFPPEALLLEMARVYRLANRPEDARKTLNQIVEQHANTPAAAEAKEELERLPG